MTEWKERKLLETEEFYQRREGTPYRERDYSPYRDPFASENLDRLVEMFVSVIEPNKQLTRNDKIRLSNVIILWYNREEPKIEDLTSSFYYSFIGRNISYTSKWFLYLLFDHILGVYFDYDIFWNFKNVFEIENYFFDEIALPIELIPEELKTMPHYEEFISNTIYLDLLENILDIINDPNYAEYRHALLELYNNIQEYSKNLNQEMHYYPISNFKLFLQDIPPEIAVYIGNTDYVLWLEKRERERREHPQRSSPVYDSDAEETPPSSSLRSRHARDFDTMEDERKEPRR